MTDLLTLLRTSPAAARALHAALKGKDGPPLLAVGFWHMDPYGSQDAGRYIPAPVCLGIDGRRLGWVAYNPKPRKTARGVRIPAGWACWAWARGWPYHQGCASEADGIARVTAALVAEGWTIHPME